MKLKEKVTSATSRALEYLRESKGYILAVIALFFMSALFAFFYPTLFSSYEEDLRKIVAQTVGLKGIDLISFILVNNAKSSLIGLASGIFGGVISIFHTFLNGSVLGYVLAKIYALSGFQNFWRILPHGIFELPAIFISLGMGLRLGVVTLTLLENFYHRYQHKRLLYLLPLILSALPTLLFALALFGNPLHMQRLGISPSFSLFVLFLVVFFAGSFILSSMLMGALSYIADKKFRALSDVKKLLRQYLTALLVFIIIVLPLLIIAAIIEGLLLAFYP